MKWNMSNRTCKRFTFISVIFASVFTFVIPAAKAVDVSTENQLNQALTQSQSTPLTNITLLNDITLMQSAVKPGGTLLIDGQGHELLSGALIRLMSPLDTGNITFQDIIFRGGNDTVIGDDGGAILINSGAVATFNNNIHFLANQAADYGGALSNKSTSTSFTGVGNVLFDGNAANSNHGGAIENDGQITFSNQGDATFHNNSGKSAGAVINLTDAKMYFSNTGQIFFTENQALTESGGALNNQGDIVFNNIGDLVFEENTAAKYGGAIYNFSGTISINNQGNTYFKNNISSQGSSNQNGGAITIINGSIELAPRTGYKMIFEGNQSENTPNAVFIRNSSALNLNPEQNAEILFYDPISSGSSTGTINQNGLGTTKIWGDNTDYQGNTNILQGAFKLMGPDSANHAWLTDPATFGTTTSGTFTLADSTTLGLWVHATNTNSHVTLQANTMTLTEGAKLYVTGISLIPHSSGEIVYENVIQTANGSGSGTLVIPTSMQNTNSLTHFELLNNANTASNGDLKITYLKNVSDVLGMEYVCWDNLRLDPDTSNDLRTFLDDMYNAPNDDLLKNLIKTTHGEGTVDSGNAHRQSGIIFNGVLISRIHGIGFEEQLDDFANSANGGDNGYNDDYSGGIPSCSHQKRPRQRSNELWGMFSQNWTRLSPSAQSNGYKYAPYAFTIGKERIVDRFLYGIAGQYYNGKVIGDGEHFTQTGIQGATLGLYSIYRGHRNYLLSTMQFGVGWNDETSYINNVVLDASYHSALLGTSLEFGRRLDFGKGRLTPHIGIDYTFYHAEAFNENGPATLARSFGSVNFNVVEVPIGLRLSREFHFRKNGGTWMPMLDVAYVRSVADNVPTSTANFAATPNTTWIASGSNIGRDAFRMTVGSKSRFRRSWDLGLSYDLETRNDYTSHQLNAVVAWRR